jgi:hypothetical protein
MSTRGAWGFRVDGEVKVAYNHYDSYPRGLGTDLIHTLGSWMYTHSMDDLRMVARRVVMVDPRDIPSPAEFDRYSWAANYGVNSGRPDWYCLLNDIQGELKWVLKGAVDHLPGGLEFLEGGLFCEWAYIIDVDAEVFEVYKGQTLIESYPIGTGLPMRIEDLTREKV